MIPAEHLADITRAQLDKARDELPRLPWLEATVVRVEGDAEAAFPRAIVVVDGDPPEKTSSMPLVGGGAAMEAGDRVVVSYTEPNGAYAFPLTRQGGYAIRLRNQCGSPG